MDHFGLPTKIIDQVRQLLAEYPSIERAVIYGSRAKGTHKPGSDIDLTLIGHAITEAEVLALESRLDDLLLPYTFDVNRFDALQNQQLIDHIHRVGQDFYKK